MMKLTKGILTVFIIHILVLTGLAQKMPLPIEHQFQTMLKVVAYESRLNAPDVNEINIGVIYVDNPVSANTKADFMKIFQTLPVQAIGQKKLNVIEIYLQDMEQLKQIIAQKNINVLYITPGMDSYLKPLKDLTVEKSLVTITGVPEYVNSHFIMVGLNVENQKPKILVNMELSKMSGAKFSANFLKFCDLIN